MSRITRCDLCDMVLMPKFSDLGYKVTVKELKHSYDGYNPWLRKTKLDICLQCMERIVMFTAQPPKKDNL